MLQTASYMHSHKHTMTSPHSGQRVRQSELQRLAQLDIDWESLPRTMARLKEALGAEGALALLATYGGANIYVPRKIKQEHTLLQTLGPENAARLADAYGGERVDVPKIDAIHRQLRKKDIVAARTQGESISDLAMRHRLSRRRVLQILAE